MELSSFTPKVQRLLPHLASFFLLLAGSTALSHASFSPVIASREDFPCETFSLWQQCNAPKFWQYLSRCMLMRNAVLCCWEWRRTECRKRWRRQNCFSCVGKSWPFAISQALYPCAPCPSSWNSGSLSSRTVLRLVHPMTCRFMSHNPMFVGVSVEALTHSGFLVPYVCIWNQLRVFPSEFAMLHGLEVPWLQRCLWPCETWRPKSCCSGLIPLCLESSSPYMPCS